MFEPVRGGTRGGQAEFKWADVSADKDRENYLGHSINAPTGRWQKNKDIHWYNRDKDANDAAEKAEEIRKIKELEAEALSAALGYEPTKPGAKSTTTTSGANAVPVASSSGSKYTATDAPADADPEMARRKSEKEERKRLKAAHKEEKRARRALKEMSRSGAHELRGLEEPHSHSRQDQDRDDGRDFAHYRRTRSSRSLSPRRRPLSHSRSRSRTPIRAPGDRFTSPPDGRVYPDRMTERPRRLDAAYDEQERESERERHRMRWERNASRRELPRDRDRNRDTERDTERRRW